MVQTPGKIDFARDFIGIDLAPDSFDPAKISEPITLFSKNLNFSICTIFLI